MIRLVFKSVKKIDKKEIIILKSFKELPKEKKEENKPEKKFDFLEEDKWLDEQSKIFAFKN